MNLMGQPVKVRSYALFAPDRPAGYAYAPGGCAALNVLVGALSPVGTFPLVSWTDISALQCAVLKKIQKSQMRHHLYLHVDSKEGDEKPPPLCRFVYPYRLMTGLDLLQ